MRSSPHGHDARVHQILRKCLNPIRVYWHFSKFNMAAAASWIFLISEFGTFCHDGCLFLELCTKYFVSLRTTRIYSWHATDDVMRINFRFRFWSCGRFPVVVMFLPNSTQISSSSTNMFATYEIKYGHRPLSWICWRKSWDHPRRPIRDGYPL